jgi:uncharacterized protein (TIGR03067 family)
MNQYIHFKFFVVLVALLIITSCDHSDSNSVDADQLKGSWRAVLAYGKNPQDANIEIIWTFHQGVITVSDGSGEIISQSRYSVDPSQDPKHIDMEIKDIDVELRRGIWVLDNRTLMISFSHDGDPRPTALSDNVSLVFEKFD